MEQIDLWSFSAVVMCQMFGATVHWYKMKLNKRIAGNFISYLIADSPGRSMATGFAIIAAAWVSATSGSADLINPQLVFEMLAQGILHVPSINAIATAVATGYAFDSMINKGETT